jgi:hypothetical protein
VQRLLIFNRVFAMLSKKGHSYRYNQNMARQNAKTISPQDWAPAHVRKFVRFHSRRLPDHHRHRLEVHARALAPHLHSEILLQELSSLLQQFSDEEKYLSPDLKRQFDHLSEINRRVFVREIKRLMEMTPAEREAYLEASESFRQGEWGYGDGGPVMRQALQVLGLKHPTSLLEIKQAYRLQAKKYHPDQGGQAERFLHLQQAYLTALKSHRRA